MSIYTSPQARRGLNGLDGLEEEHRTARHPPCESGTYPPHMGHVRQAMSSERNHASYGYGDAYEGHGPHPHSGNEAPFPKNPYEFYHHHYHPYGFGPFMGYTAHPHPHPHPHPYHAAHGYGSRAQEHDRGSSDESPGTEMKTEPSRAETLSSSGTQSSETKIEDLIVRELLFVANAQTHKAPG